MISDFKKHIYNYLTYVGFTHFTLKFKYKKCMYGYDNENSQNINIKQIMFEHDICFLKANCIPMR